MLSTKMSVARDDEFNNMPTDSNTTVMTPLIPNPNSSHPKDTNVSEIPSYCSFSSHSTNLLTLNHHLGMLYFLIFTHLSYFLH